MTSVCCGARPTHDLFLEAVRVLQLTVLPLTNSAPLRRPGTHAQNELGTSAIITLWRRSLFTGRNNGKDATFATTEQFYKVFKAHIMVADI